MAYQIGEKVNIRNIRDTHVGLLAQFAKQDVIEIDADGVGECDLSLVQLIEAARIQGRAAGKEVRLMKPANDAVTATLKRAGFLENFSAEDTQFWFHKEMI
jgi:hypothetical protein